MDGYRDGFLALMKCDIDLRTEDEGRPDLAALVPIDTIEVGVFYQSDDWTVSAIRTTHPPCLIAVRCPYEQLMRMLSAPEIPRPWMNWQSSPKLPTF